MLLGLCWTEDWVSSTLDRSKVGRCLVVGQPKDSTEVRSGAQVGHREAGWMKARRITADLPLFSLIIG